jgi:hypothetical protein
VRALLYKESRRREGGKKGKETRKSEDMENNRQNATRKRLERGDSGKREEGLSYRIRALH